MHYSRSTPIRSSLPTALRPQPRNQFKLKLLSSDWLGVPSRRGRGGPLSACSAAGVLFCCFFCSLTSPASSVLLLVSSCVARLSMIHRRRDASAGCVARSSTIRPRRDASAVHRAASSRRVDGCVVATDRRFTVVAMRRRSIALRRLRDGRIAGRFLLLVVVVIV
jgi:hypothetical protein